MNAAAPETATVDVQDVLDQVVAHDFEAFRALGGLHAPTGTRVPGTHEKVAEILNTAPTPAVAGQRMLWWLLVRLAEHGLWELPTVDVWEVCEQVRAHDFEAFLPLAGLHLDARVPGTHEEVAEILNAAATSAEAGQAVLRWLMGHLVDIGEITDPTLAAFYGKHATDDDGSSERGVTADPATVDQRGT